MHQYHPYSIFPLGDSALTIQFGDFIDPGINRKAISLFRHLGSLHLPWITDLVPSYAALAIYYHLPSIYELKSAGMSAFEWVAIYIESIAGNEKVYPPQTPEVIKIPVCYAPAFAPDMQAVSTHTQLTADEVIAAHVRNRYQVYMIGFLPGFPYMGIIDKALEVPRKAVPSPQVQPGSIGIAGSQTGIYPLTSPGGWQIIGRTPLKIFDRQRNDPVMLKPGDEVDFYSISEDEYRDYQTRTA